METEKTLAIVVLFIFLSISSTILIYSHLMDSKIVRMVEQGADPLEARLALCGGTTENYLMLSDIIRQEK